MVGGDTVRLARLVAARRLRERPLRSALTAAGVAGGVALLFSIMLLNAELAHSVRTTGAAVTGPRLLQVSAASPGGLPVGLAAELATDVRVDAAAPVAIDRTTVSAGTHRTGIFVVGVTADVVRAAPEVTRGVTAESSGPFAPGLIISRSLASRLSIRVGGLVAVDTPTRETEQPVAAVVSSPLLDRVNNGMAAIMRLPDAQRLFGRPDRVDEIIVSARPGTNLSALRSDLARRVAPAATVGLPGAATGAATSDLDAYLLLAQACGLLALLVAAILVTNTMTMTMAEHRIEIALAGSLGATRRQLVVAAVAEAALLGAVGTVAGLIAGGVLARAVLPVAHAAYQAVSPVDTPTRLAIRLGPLVASAAAGMFAAVVGAFVPARRAARATPIDALRPAAAYEWRDPTRSSRTVALALAGAALFTIGTIVGLRLASTTDSTMTSITIAMMFGGLALLLPAGVPLAASVLAALIARLWPATGRLAGDALRANPRRTSITVAALGLPLALVVAFTAAFDAATTKFDRVAHAFVVAPLTVDANSFAGYTASQPLAPSDQRILGSVPGVRAALADENAFIGLPDGTQGVLFAIPLTAAERTGVANMVQDDRLSDKPTEFRRGLAAGQIAASHLAARNLHLHVGSSVTLPTPSGGHTFTVAALYEDWAMRGTFYIDHDTYTSVWGDQGALRYAIIPTPGTSLPALRQRLNDTVTAAGMAAQVRTRDEAIGELLSGLTNLITILRGTELAMLLCAALTLANTAFTAVAERRWTFGLQRALGTTRRQLSRSLILEALATGLIGSIAGAVIGLGLSVFLTHVMAARASSRLPHPIPWAALAASIVLGAGIAFLATQYPRRTAGRLTIIESLRYE